jgi:acyl-homoserine-lactone acylase
MKALCKVLAAALLYLTAFSVTCSAWADPPTKGTEILWDRYGIPHIFAPDRPSLFYAYGYAQMEAHAELLIRLYTQSRGRAAEFYAMGRIISSRTSGSVRTESPSARKNGPPSNLRNLLLCSPHSSMA